MNIIYSYFVSRIVEVSSDQLQVHVLVTFSHDDIEHLQTLIIARIQYLGESHLYLDNFFGIFAERSQFELLQNT